ncbi:MAG: hypothetical protein GYB55_10280 [Cytophagales bacterium]|nr:hypothetical protein [Cytophagales bacterium]|tara:strand:- start:44378 stop:44581 length:204 start_codon:yes stop_codon:yes gene_type:complete
MIRIDEQKNEVVITLPKTDRSEIAEIRKALLDLIAEYNFEDFGSSAQGTMYFTTRLIKALDFDIESE